MVVQTLIYHRRRLALPCLRLVAESDAGRSRHEPQFGVGHFQRRKAAPHTALKSLGYHTRGNLDLFHHSPRLHIGRCRGTLNGHDDGAGPGSGDESE